MAIKLTQTEQEQIYFCTFTCLNWLHLFEVVNLYDEIYKWFNLLIIDQNQPKNVPANIIISTGNTLKKLNIADGSGSVPLPKFANIVPIIINWKIMGIPNVSRNKCQCFAFKNLSVNVICYLNWFVRCQFFIVMPSIVPKPRTFYRLAHNVCVSVVVAYRSCVLSTWRNVIE